LIGFRNRLVVMLDGGSAYLSFSRNARVVASTLQNHTHSSER
jgi:hypothetical protein